MYKSREEVINAEASKAGYEEYVLPGYGTCPGWYSHNMFLFGDYIGCNVQQANIQATLDHIGACNTNTLNPDYDQDMLNAMKDFPVLILRLDYNTEQVIFNMHKLAGERPDFYDELLGISDYPVLDEEILYEVNEQRIKSAWDFSVDDILKDVYEACYDREWNAIGDFRSWVDSVYEEYGGKDGLREIFRGYNSSDDWDDYTDEYVEHETGRNVYFRLKDHKGFTPPMLRLIKLTKLYNEEEIRVEIPTRK